MCPFPEVEKAVLLKSYRGRLHADYSICPSRRSHDKNVGKIIVFGLFLYFWKVSL